MISTILFFITFIFKLIIDVKTHTISNPYKRSIIWYLLFYTFPILYFMETRNTNAIIEWATAYNIELALSVDNLAVILMLMSTSNVVGVDQKTVLNYGIFGAVAMRLVLLTVGLGLLTKFSMFIFPIFGLLLLKAAWKMYEEVKHPGPEGDEADNKLLDNISNILKKVSLPKWLPIVLLPVVLAVEATDLLFAIDSIPAVLAISSNWFVVVTSNLAAVAFLREIFFVFSDLQKKLCYLNYGVAGALLVIGLKLIAHPLLHMNHIEIAPLYSLLGVMVPIIASVAASFIKSKSQERIKIQACNI